MNTGVTNKPAPKEATGFECDKLAPAGAEQHFAGYIGRISAPGGPADGGRLEGMLIDSWECFTQTWTPAMEKEFAKRRGYDLRKWLPALAGWVVESPEKTERFYRDWRATLSDMTVSNYFGRLAELGRERGLKLSFETAAGDIPTGDILEYYKNADIPMCEFWQPNDPLNGGLETKPIAPTVSAAHIYGKPRIAAEAFTSVPVTWDEHPFALKHYADRNFAKGVTHLVFHTYTHNPLEKLPGTTFGGKIGTPFLRGQTWWKHMPLFTDYLARCQIMLEQGHPVADVLWYLGDDVDARPRQDEPFPAGYQFDYLNADALIERLSVSANGSLTIPEGTSWKVLWLAENQCRRLTPATLEKIKQLLEGGATVIGPAPSQNPSLEGDGRFLALVIDLWGDAPANHGDRKIGKGRLLWGGELGETLGKLKITPDLTDARSATWAHRSTNEHEIYFIAAEHASPLDANLHFRAEGKAKFWNPLTGESSPVNFFSENREGTTVPVRLPAAGSVFVVFSKDAANSGFESVSLDGKTILDATDATRTDQGEPFPHLGLSRSVPIQPWVEPALLDGDFSRTDGKMIAWRSGEYVFARKGAVPISISARKTREIVVENSWKLAFTDNVTPLEKITPWSELKGDASRHFSGTATYRTEIDLKASAKDELAMLDLGRVGDIAVVRINGERVTTLWAPPFRAEITKFLKQGINLIEIDVTNTWHNRLAFEAALPEKERSTWTYNYPQSDSPLEFSGIRGPVKIMIGQALNISHP